MRRYDVIAEICDAMVSLGWQPYQNDHEDANGQFEMNWQYDTALRTADRLGLPRFQTLQPEYNLVMRQGFESALQSLCVRESVSVIPYYALASGFLTGKYRRPEDTASRTRGGRVAGYMDARGIKGAWEALVCFVNEDRTAALQRLAAAAPWFETRMPWDPRWRRTRRTRSPRACRTRARAPPISSARTASVATRSAASSPARRP